MRLQRTEDSFSELDAITRRNAALKRMLSTPHKPHKEIRGCKCSLGKGAQRRADQCVSIFSVADESFL
jgi:hypothetical protein